MEVAHDAPGAGSGLGPGERRRIDTGELNLQAAAALLRGLVATGIRRVVISPGSRSSPLALAADLSPLLETVVLPDERSAAFFALGQARAERLPVAIIATSGTAPANWYPAVIESSMDAVPLVFISADRPAELLHTGANQTIDQDGMFAGYPRAFLRLPAPGDESPAFYESAGLRAAERALWPRPGPVHLNVAFREPLLPDATDPCLEWPAAVGSPPDRPEIRMTAGAASEVARQISGRPGAIVCGRADYPSAFAGRLATLARCLDCPIIADPLSGLRWGEHDHSRIVTTADLMFDGAADAWTAEWIIQFGASPTSRPVQDWIAGHGDRLILAGPFGDWQDPARAARRILRSDPLPLVERLLETGPEPGPGDWMAGWKDRESALAALCETDECRPPEAEVIRSLEDGLPDAARLFVGNSMPVRSLDTFARGRTIRLRAVGNRGASGIDGCVSTIAGLAACGDPTLGLIGDLALYHDMNGLLAVRETTATIVVINNGGGAIFGLLPQHSRPEFERLWMTPTGLDLRRVAQLYGIPHALAEPEDLTALAAGGPRLVEISVDAEQSWARHRALREAAKRI